MPELTLTVNSRNYDMACGEGEEPHLLELAEFIDGKITAIVGEGGRRGDTRLLLMATLLIADELFEAQKNAPAPASAAASEQDEEAEIAFLSEATKKLEAIAAGIAGA